MELARVLGALKRKGWVPRRSLGFALWGAIEESESIGSDLWVAQNDRLLQARGMSVLKYQFVHAVSTIHTEISSPHTMLIAILCLPSLLTGPILHGISG
jgi:hypothetical protein